MLRSRVSEGMELSKVQSPDIQTETIARSLSLEIEKKPQKITNA